MEVLALVLFIIIFAFILIGFPVAFVLGGVAVIVGYFALGIDFMQFLPLRIMGVMSNYVLIAVPLFIFMGLSLQKSGIAESLLVSMSEILYKFKGGIALSVVFVGALMAASTGIVGATVVTMGAISLPLMIKNNYNKQLATGIIAASGTLGQIIPPSIVLVLLGSVFNISVGDLFAAAFIPGFILVLVYLIYVFVRTQFGQYKTDISDQVKPVVADLKNTNVKSRSFLVAFLMPMGLIVAVLGSIYFGFASPTEAAAIGALGSLVLAAGSGKLNWNLLKDVSLETTKMTSMVFFILLGATTFTLVFRGLGGDGYMVDLIQQGGFGAKGFLLLVMLIVFIAGFFIDFIEIIFIIVPVILPILKTYTPAEFSPVLENSNQLLIWFAVLLALNLQTSFLTPPFGFSLFYLKGVAPDSIQSTHIYRGIIPFILIQLALLLLIVFVPELIFVLLK